MISRFNVQYANLLYNLNLINNSQTSRISKFASITYFKTLQKSKNIIIVNR